ncbi:chaperonin 10-like protein [Xylaria scruposa]|nr:chaperonin 10-like protein [Xylaria scruposa]
MGYPETFTGFVIESQSTNPTFHKAELEPKVFEDYDVDIAIEACGVCGSDVHKITGGWGPCSLPLCVGHEVVGKVVRLESKVSTVAIGDRVGVGAQISACLKCKNCQSDNENYCPHMVDTYDGRYPDGTVSQGGYSSHIRAHEYFVFKIPDVKMRMTSLRDTPAYTYINPNPALEKSELPMAVLSHGFKPP